MRETREKKPYLNLQLADKSGFLDARKWDTTPQLSNSFQQDSYIKIKGVVETFNGTMQIKIVELCPVDEARVQKGGFIPCTDKDVPTMMAELKAIIETIRGTLSFEIIAVIF